MAVDGTEHVLDAIDGALRDCTVSNDAMRWTPEAPEPLHQPRQNGRGSMHTTDLMYFEWAADLPPMTPWQRRVLDFVLQPDRDISPLIAANLAGWGGRGFGRTARMAALAHTHRQALRQSAEQLSRSMNASDDEVERLMETLADLSSPVLDQPEDDEDPRARALRLRRQRGTGPGRTLAGQQKRPRSLA